MRHNFAHKKILITGASAGIGLGFAKEFARRQAEILLVARRAELLEHRKRDLLQLGALDVQVFALDLCDRESFSPLEKIFTEQDIYGLVNNAGHGSFGELADLPFVWEEHMIDLNVRAFSYLAHQAATHMRARKQGLLINVSSLAGFQPLPYMATYSATKAYDLFLSLALERELKSHGVQVLSVCPGPVATEFGGVARVPGTATGGKRDSVEDVVAECFQAIAKGRGMILPCRRARYMGYVLHILPVRMRVRIIEKMLRKPLVLSRLNVKNVKDD